MSKLDRSPRLRPPGRLLAAAAVALTVGSLVGQPGERVSALQRAPTPSRPNIVVLLLDDIPEMGTRIFERMPRVNELFVQQGLRFKNHYANDPLCCPGRASFLTGLYAHHHGVTVNDGTLFDPSMTIATTLQDAGYYTFIAGKYLNGTSDLASKTPPGWDHTSITSGKYYEYEMFVDGIAETHGDAEEDYMTDVASERALAFLREARQDQPVFAVLAPFAAHTGADPTRPTNPLLAVPARRHILDARCQGIGVRKGPAYNEVDVSDKPQYIRETKPVAYAGGWPLDRICETLLSADDMFDAVVRELISQGRFDNTLFVLTADNGMTWGNHRWPRKSVPYATNIPLMVYWEGAIGTVAKRVDAWTSMVDLAPTLAAAAGAAPLGPFPTGQAAPDGRSVLQLWKTRGLKAPRRDALLEEHPAGFDVEDPSMSSMPPWYAVRTTGQSRLGLWHYVEYESGERELYALAGDPNELTNRAGEAQFASVQAALAARLAELRTP